MMPDRVLRSDLFDSDRWIDLHSTDARLLFVYLLTVADDYGNFKNSGVIFRRCRNFIDVKSEQSIAQLLCELADADLIRGYQADGCQYFHIPRFKNSRRYWARKCPQSPYDEQMHPTSIQWLTKNPHAGLTQDDGSPDDEFREDDGSPDEDLMRGVGVGVGVGSKP